MHITKATILVICTLLIVEATKVNQCENAPESRQLNDNEVIIQKCKQGRCKLKKRTEVEVKMKFYLEEDTKDIINSVWGEILQIPLPFVGVDRTSACNAIYNEDETEKVSCPLKGGKSYWYKNGIKVLEIYPKVDVNVHWELKARNGKTISCFEVPAKITS